MAKKFVTQEIPNLALFQRCRALHEELDRLRTILPATEVIAAIERADISQMPPDQQRMAKRILRDMADLTAKEAELETLTMQAEEAVQQLPNINLRRVTQLYCIDGMRWQDVLQHCGCCERTVSRCLSLLKKKDEAADSSRADGR